MPTISNPHEKSLVALDSRTSAPSRRRFVSTALAAVAAVQLGFFSFPGGSVP